MGMCDASRCFQDYHVLSVEAIEARFRTSVQQGLSTMDAEQKLGRNGPNHPTVKSPTLDIDEFATKKVLVRRDGYRKAIESRELVVGYIPECPLSVPRRSVARPCLTIAPAQ